MAGGGRSPEARVLAAERTRQIIELRIRGVSFEQIGRQLNIKKQSAYNLYKRVLHQTPKADLEELRKLEAERIADLRQRVWTELAGRPDPTDPNKTIRPEPERLADLVRTAIRISRHEAMVFGLDAPTKVESGTLGMPNQPMSDEEANRQWARLTSEEQEQFMMLLQKMQGRWIEPRAIEDGAIETTAEVIGPTKGPEQ